MPPISSPGTRLSARADPHVLRLAGSGRGGSCSGRRRRAWAGRLHVRQHNRIRSIWGPRPHQCDAWIRSDRQSRAELISARKTEGQPSGRRQLHDRQAANFRPQGEGFFCFALKNQSDFQVSKDLKGVSLHTFLTPQEMCNFRGPVTGKAAPAPLAGGGGPVIQPPFQVDITWAATGVRGSGRDRGTFSCGSYSTNATTDIKTAGETATGTIDVLKGSFASTTAGIMANNTHLDIKGFPLQGCFGFSSHLHGRRRIT